MLSQVMPTLLLITLCLWTEYGLKQWFEPVFASRTVGYAHYVCYRMAHAAVLAMLLFFVYQPSLWFFPIILLAVALGSIELVISPVQQLIHSQYGIRCRWLYLLPMIWIVLLALNVAQLRLSPTMEQLHAWPGSAPMIYLCTYILLSQPTNFVIRWLVDKDDDLLLSEMIHRPLDWQVGQREMAAASEPAGISTLQAGRVIGILERWIIFTLVVISQYSLIGLVLTAKSVARFKQIQDDATFAEYFLLGTLYSTLIALVAGILVSGLLGG